MRIGLIVPSSNTVVERDFAVLIGGWASLHSARMYLAETTEAAERSMIRDYVPQAVTDLATLRPDVVVFACTSAGAVLGPDAERQLIADISTKTGAAVVSTNRAVKDAIARRAPNRIAVITPYVDELNQRIRTGLEMDGFSVAAIAGMGITENFAIAEVAPDAIVTFARDALVGSAFDLLFVSCTNLPAVDAISDLEHAFGRPVVTSNQATIEGVYEAAAPLRHPTPITP